MSSRCVFLDRDGTINEEVCYLRDVSQFRLIEGSAQGIRLLNQAGFKVVVITNQAGVARGYLTENVLENIHRTMQEQLRTQGAVVDAIYHCPHHPTEGLAAYRRTCDCRKPNPGMLRAAANELDLDLSESFVVGDKLSDLQAGHAVGCSLVLVRTGYGREHEGMLHNHAFVPDYVAADVLDASQWIQTQPPRDTHWRETCRVYEN